MANWRKTLLICIALLAVAAVLLFLIFSTEPVPQRDSAGR
jgi:hypothetical protein